MKYSVIIPSYNGAGRIHNILDSLQKQSYPDFEVILVVDGSTDNTTDVLKEHSFNYPLQSIEQVNKGRAGARNAGVKRATGEFLLFFDDDVILEQDTIAHYDIFRDKTHSEVIVGAVIPIKSTNQSEFEKYCSFLNTRWGITESGSPLGFPYITANNFLISRRIFNEFYGFDERLRDAEDFELAVRLFERKIPIHYCPDAVVGHELFEDFSTYIHRQREYKAANKQLIQINPSVTKYRKIHSITPLKKILYQFFKPRFWISVLDKELFTFLPRNIRFALYSKIIYAQKELN